jgi:WD40 repeat protein
MVGNWLYGVAFRTSMSARAVSAKRRQKEQQRDVLPETETMPLEPAPDLGPLLDQELDCLPDKYRIAIVLCDLEGKTHKQAARQLGWPVGTMSTRLLRGRKLLAKRLAQRGIPMAGGTMTAVTLPGVVSAHVPPMLLVSTLRFANLFAAGSAAAPVVPDKVVALTKEVSKSMFLTQLKVGSAILFLAGILFGVGFLAQPTLVAEQRAFVVEKPNEKKTDSVPATILSGAGEISCIAWSPDGKTVAVVTQGGKVGVTSAVTLWDVKKREVRDTLDETHEQFFRLRKVLFSLDGRVMATCADGIDQNKPRGLSGVVKIWDAKTGALKKTIEHDFPLVCVALSPDGKWVVAGSQEKTVMLWNAETGTLDCTIETGETWPWSVSFSPDGTALAIGGGKIDGSGEVTISEPKTGTVKHVFKQEKHVSTVAFSPDGKVVASGGHGQLVQLWDLKKGALLISLQCPETVCDSVEFSPDSKTVAGAARDGKVRIWDVQSGVLKKTLEGHQSQVRGVAFSPDGKTLASGSLDKTIRLWAIGKPTKVEQKPKQEPDRTAREDLSNTQQLVRQLADLFQQQDLARKCDYLELAPNINMLPAIGGLQNTALNEFLRLFVARRQCSATEEGLHQIKKSLKQP